MSADSILEKYAERCGWGTEAQLAIVLEYIENQGDPDGFDDFLAQQADLEASASEG